MIELKKRIIKNRESQGSTIAYECCSIYNQSRPETGYLRKKVLGK